MAKRIYIENNYLVIAENTDLTDDKRNVANNVYLEKNGELFLFYKKSNDELIESILFADVLDVNGVAYSNVTTFKNLIEDATGGVKLSADGAVEVLIQDNDSPDISLYMAEKLDDVTVLVTVAIDDETINIETTGVTPIVGNFLCLRDAASFYQAEISTVTPVAGNQYTLEVSIPFDFAYSTIAGCELQNVNMNVNGSVTPVTFSLKAKGLDLFAFDIIRMSISMVLSSAGDDGLFGNIAELNEGVYFRTVDGITKNLFNARSNSDFAEEAAGDVTYPIRSGGGGSHGMRARISFNGQDKRGVVKRLKVASEDEFIGVVRDNLTGINRFRIKLQGQVAID